MLTCTDNFMQLFDTLKLFTCFLISLELVIHLVGGIRIVGYDLDFLSNYNQPSAAGGLFIFPSVSRIFIKLFR